MKKIYLLILLVFCGVSLAQAQREFEMKSGDTTFVMKKYFMCFLKRGANKDIPEEELKTIQEKHLNHLSKLFEEGKICIAGPFEGEGDLRGITVFDVDTKEEAEKLASEDPAVIAGRLTVEIIPWWTAKGSVLK